MKTEKQARSNYWLSSIESSAGGKYAVDIVFLADGATECTKGTTHKRNSMDIATYICTPMDIILRDFGCFNH